MLLEMFVTIGAIVTIVAILLGYHFLGKLQGRIENLESNFGIHMEFHNKE